jgi:hypothetical protein
MKAPRRLPAAGFPEAIMIPVYTAASTLDAQLVQDLLVGSGITAHVLGPNVADLRGGAVAGGYRVVVEEGEADAAHELIADWQTGPAADDEDFDLLDSLPLQDGA